MDCPGHIRTDHDPARLSHLQEVFKELDKVAGSDVPLVAFGQTPLWDEPMKCIMAEGNRRLIVGIHDLDYFSRLRAPLPGSAWKVVPRNDGSTRETWIAAGELSALFGAEQWPTQQALNEAGVRLDHALGTEHGARLAALDKLTEAWGWRGIVQNAAEPSVICDIPAKELLSPLLELMKWGFSETEKTLAQHESRAAVKEAGDSLSALATKFVAENPKASMSALYEAMLTRVYVMLLGKMPENVEIQSLRRVLTFNTKTAGLPRFRFVGNFLEPAISGQCRAAYDSVVESAMLQLAASGEGALPFDVYVPGKGRGTLHVTERFVRIDLPTPIEFNISAPIHSVQRLAEALEAKLGHDIALTGKALALIPMITGEFVMMLTETGSAYLPRTGRLLGAMRQAGADVRAFPLLRIRLNTWDSLAVCDAEFNLPEHLAYSFGKETISGMEFGRGWHKATHNAERTLNELKRLAGPCDLARYLGDKEREVWLRRLKQCTKANEVLVDVQVRASKLRLTASDLREKEDEATDEIRALERRRGDLNRSLIRPLKRRLAAMPDDAAADERKRLEAEYAHAAREGEALLLALGLKVSERRKLRAQRKELGQRLRASEKGSRAVAARRVLASVERAAARGRGKLARNAILTLGLEHSDVRPAAWWMPAVDPSGKWFERIRRTASFHFEPLLGKKE